jgi:glutamate synthase (NADPH) large chain
MAHAMMMMIPEPWSGHESMPDDKKAFYEYHACMHGAVGRPGVDGVYRRRPDRRGARPQRPASVAVLGDDDDFVVMASEVGVLDMPQEKIVKKGRLEPGRMFLIDTENGGSWTTKRSRSDLQAQAVPRRGWTRTGAPMPKKLPP